MIAKRTMRYQHTKWYGMVIWYLSLLQTDGYVVRVSNKLYSA